MAKGKHSEAEIIGALKQLEAGRTAEDVGREMGVSKHTIYAWKAKSGGLDVNEAQRLRQLEDENHRLKKLVADASLTRQNSSGTSTSMHLRFVFRMKLRASAHIHYRLQPVIRQCSVLQGLRKVSMQTHNYLIVLLIVIFALPLAAQRRVPEDLSGVRGFNYEPAEARGNVDQWLKYDPAVTERDFEYAKRLQLNQVRVWVTYRAWEKDKEMLKKNLIHFVRAAHERGIGVMPTMAYKFGEWKDKSAWPNARPFAADLVAAIGKEPGLEIWDVQNEPECCTLPPDAGKRLHMEHAMYMTKVFHELDPATPVTIGATFADNMIEMGDAVDVLSFHDYSATRFQVRANIEKAKQYAAKVGKPLVNSEMACIARANPYDVTLQEHMQAHVGWYIFELMITPGWGNVHGIFYPDGTVRDPSIVAALFGMFRSHGTNVVEEVPDRENHLTEAVAKNKKWLADTNPDWKTGLDLAETSANLLESAQIAPMHDLPTRKVDLLRGGQQDIAALRATLETFTSLLAPYQLAPGDPRRARALQ